MEKKVKEGARAEIVLNILLFLVARGSSHAHQSKSKDIWVLLGKKKKKQPNKLPIFLNSVSAIPPTPTLRGWNFLLMAQCKRPLSYRKLTLKMSTRDRREEERKLQNTNACHDGAFWQNLESLHCWHTFLFARARETDYY